MNASVNEVFRKVQQLVANKYSGSYPNAFKAYDMDGNGKLGPKDLHSLLEDCGIGNWLTRGVWVSSIISTLDTDGDGAVSTTELIAAFLAVEK